MKKLNSIIKNSAITLGLLQCINQTINACTTKNSNVKVSGKYYHWKQGNIFYKMYGKGKPLLLIHDLTVFSSGYEWSQVINFLAENHTVYAVDLIGCGKSDKPLLTYTGFFYAQLIRDFVNNVIGKQTDVIASGLSSEFVFLTNNLEQNLFHDIIIINPKDIKELKITPNQYSKGLIKLFNFPVIGKTLYYLLTNKENTEYFLTERYFYNPFKLKPSFIKAAYIASHTANGNGKMLFASLKGNYLNMDISKAVTNTKNRIILITGGMIANREDIISSYMRLNKNIIELSVPNAKYYPHQEAPEQTSRLFSVLS